MGLGLAEAAQVVEKTCSICASTAMIFMMHYCADALIERFGNECVRRNIAAGRRLSTLARSEAGSRSHFWAPLGTARREGGEYALDCVKSWVTSAMEADSYVWSSRPAGGEGASTLWLVDGKLKGGGELGHAGLGLSSPDKSPPSNTAIRM
jgi:alkylation response protein AidB-like acyl-CoA dehydrogenase